VTLTIELAGLELHGRHGVLEEERREGQRFLFDLWLDVPETAARSDRIEDAVDYREVVATVREVSDGNAYALLEALATAVAEALLERFPVERARVRVRKPDVRLDAPVEHSAVTAELAAAPGRRPPAGS
jgi:dihydroneopterin aldolase